MMGIFDCTPFDIDIDNVVVLTLLGSFLETLLSLLISTLAARFFHEGRKEVGRRARGTRAG